jgi:hypothetical protein
MRSLLLMLLASMPVMATPKPLAFSYSYETLPKGETEVELYGDLTPTVAISSATGSSVGYLKPEFQLEAEYGITDQLELGFYVTLAPEPGESLVATPSTVQANGLKQRLRYRFAEAGEWPLDVGLYFELVENVRELELEAKVILQRRFGLVRLIANLAAELELYFDGRREWVLAPTAGATFEVRPWLHLGLEYWMRAELPARAGVFNLGPHHYLGPVVNLNFGRVWWTTGVYVRGNDFGRPMQTGDGFGAVWVRTILGVGL